MSVLPGVQWRWRTECLMTECLKTEEKKIVLGKSKKLANFYYK